MRWAGGDVGGVFWDGGVSGDGAGDEVSKQIYIDMCLIILSID